MRGYRRCAEKVSRGCLEGAEWTRAGSLREDAGAEGASAFA